MDCFLVQQLLFASLLIIVILLYHVKNTDNFSSLQICDYYIIRY